MSRELHECLPSTARLLILGSGPAGYTAAVYAARANLKPVLITGMQQGGQLMTTTEVDNWPADVDGVQGPELMERFQKHAERFNTEIIFDHIHTAKLTEKPFTLIGDAGTYTCDALIIATGASAKYLGLPSEAGLHGQGRVRLRHLRRLLLQEPGCGGDRRRQYRGGRSAVPRQHRQHVTLVHRRDTFSAEKILIDHLMEKVEEGKITLELNHDAGRSAGRQHRRHRHAHQERQRRQHQGHRAERRVHRHRPQAQHRPLRRPAGNGKRLHRHHGGNHGNATATSIPGVFAAGDVQDHIYRQAITSAGTGCMAALDAERYLDNLGK